MQPRLHAILNTHTTRHLEHALRGIARQTGQPDTLLIACDSDDGAIAETINMVTSESRGPRIPTLHVFRPNLGHATLAQIRNNAVRALRAEGRLHPSDTLLYLDGDIVLDPNGVRGHLAAARDADLTIAFRLNLPEEATARLTPDTGWDEILRAIPGDERSAVARRHAKYRRNAAARRLGLHRVGLLKPHKPKIIGCHFAVRASHYAAVNGFDEGYTGHGFEDDDFVRRLHLLRQPDHAPTRVRVAVGDIHAIHLYHASRKVENLDQTPQGRRFAAGVSSPVCSPGLVDPAPQPEPERVWIHPPGESSIGGAPSNTPPGSTV